MADLANLAITCTSSPSSAPAPDVYSIFGHLVTVKPSDIGTVVVALAIGGMTVWIANCQRRIATEKVISDLFEKRYAIYDVHLRAIVSVCMRNFDPDANHDVLDETIYLGEQARFLLDIETHLYLCTIRQRLFQITENRKRMKEIKSEQNISKEDKSFRHDLFMENHNFQTELLKEIEGKLPDMFMKFLRVADFRTNS
ncbi:MULTISPECIES: hypothetical protein [Komagataeibacter]|uniref:hypothetical protein n=1 Tax=Komagataeibacter TaxID=1434011 RepID=UPI0011B63C90|nr:MULTISPECIES: hypothetical protein [Komagataeibacter]